MMLRTNSKKRLILNAHKKTNETRIFADYFDLQG